MEFRLELISLLISPFFFFSFFDKYTHLFFITCFEGESSPPPPPIKQRQHYFSRCHKNNIFRHFNRNYGSMSKKEKKKLHTYTYTYIYVSVYVHMHISMRACISSMKIREIMISVSKTQHQREKQGGLLCK